MKSPLQFVLPTGSLSEQTREFLAKAGYDVGKPDRRGFCGAAANGMIRFWERDRRMIPELLQGRFDAGITGRDLLMESGVTGLRIIAQLCYSKRTHSPTRWVLAAPAGHGLDLEEAGHGLLKVRVGCELPALCRTLLCEHAIHLRRYDITEVRRISGYEEMAVEDRLCDLIMVVTETGKSLEDQKFSILPGCERMLVSMPLILAKSSLSQDQEEAVQELSFALRSAIGAASRVMLKADLTHEALRALQLPAEVSPSILPLQDGEGIAVEICIPRTDIGVIGLRLERAGARGIVVQEVIAYAAGNKKAD